LARCKEVEPLLMLFQLGTAALGLSIISSTKVFHCEHEGHLPNHLGASKPQLWQKYADFVLDIFLISEVECSISDYIIVRKVTNNTNKISLK
jgi:hypothetical protein